MDDELIFIEESAEAGVKSTSPPWRVLVVDDEPLVHAVTELALDDFTFEGRRLELLSCESAAAAEAILASEDDIAVVLLDVVMESETAGLDLALRIRRTLNNRRVRIVLRTGQPGWISEEQVIRDYAINDYLHKTDLTPRKLAASLVFSLRDYQDIVSSSSTH
jgi:CheY-like chemotaxis protein